MRSGTHDPDRAAGRAKTLELCSKPHQKNFWKSFSGLFKTFNAFLGWWNAALGFSTVIGSTNAIGTGILPLLFVLLWKYSPIPTGMYLAGSAVRVVVPERIRQYRSGYSRTAKSLSNPFFKSFRESREPFSKGSLVEFEAKPQGLFGSAVRVVGP